MAYHKCASIYGTANSAASVQTASGPIANFNTKLAMPIKSLEVDVNAVQDLHGQSAPYPSGGQLWDEEWEVGSLDNTTGLPTPDPDNIRAKNYCYCSPNTSYYFYIGVSKNIRYYWYDANKQLIDNNTVRNNTITSPNNARYFKIRTTQTYGNTYLNNISVNYPSTDTDYHPYSNICPIGGWDSVKVARTGINIWNGITEFGRISTSTGEDYSYTGTRCVGYLKVTPNTNYFITSSENIYFIEYDANKNYIRYNGYKANAVYKTSNDCYYLRFYSVIENLPVFGINYPSTKTTYEAYNGTEVIISLGQTVYGGHFTQDKDGHRRFEVTYKEYDLSAMNWSLSTIGPSKWYSLVSDSLVKNGNTLCPIYTSGNDNDWTTLNNIINVNTNVNGSFIRISDTRFENLTRAEIQALLSGVKAYCVLTTPFTIDLPDGQPIKTLPGVNNIYADTGDAKVSYKKLA